VDAQAHADGRSGVTSGRYKVIGTVKDGKDVVLSTGGYVTVWRLEKDGTWEVVFDADSPDPPAPANE
jgi:ketosteroid isomerase-like protein